MPIPVRATAVAALVLALACPVLLAQQPAAAPPSVQPILDALGIKDVSTVSYQDESGNAINAEDFARQTKAGKSFSTSLQRINNGPSALTLKLASKAELEKMKRADIKLRKGDAFPEFRLSRLDGTMADNKSLAGKYTLVSFYFADCKPCVKEVPELNELAANRKDVHLLAVTFDSAEESRRFVKTTGFTWPIVPDASKLTKEAGVTAYPLMMLLDQEGKLVQTRMGEFGAKGVTLAAWLDKAMASPR